MCVEGRMLGSIGTAYSVCCCEVIASVVCVCEVLQSFVLAVDVAGVVV